MLPLWAAAQATRGVSLTEDRVALVIGNAAYKRDPLDNPVNDARLIASRLEQAGFKVTRRENLDRNGMAAALRDFGAALNENTVAVLYYAGHAMQLRDQNYMIPIDAEIRSEDEVGMQGVDLTFILGRMSRAKSRVNVVILDACRDNPFAKRAGGGIGNAQGLAQMDAPIGTLLAYATAPGKQAPDGIGQRGNSIYTTELARHLLTPGLPVELMFKRVREAVVRESRQLQVPWEHSSLLGEFAFVPGVNASTDSADADGSAEAALWASVQASNRADDFRAYLRQYPRGRFAEAARTRIAALSSVAPPSTAATAAEMMPRVGDTWRYRVTDQFRFGDLFVTARVDAVAADSVAETWTTTVDAKVRTTRVALQAGVQPVARLGRRAAGVRAVPASGRSARRSDHGRRHPTARGRCGVDPAEGAVAGRRRRGGRGRPFSCQEAGAAGAGQRACRRGHHHRAPRVVRARRAPHRALRGRVAQRPHGARGHRVRAHRIQAAMRP